MCNVRSRNCMKTTLFTIKNVYLHSKSKEPAMNNKLYFLEILFLCFSFAIHPQISHGGKPLPFTKNKFRTSSEGLFVEMPAFNYTKALRSSSEDNQRFKSLHFAHKFLVHLRPENSGVRFKTMDGRTIWRVGIRSRKAHSLNILFSKFRIPEGAKLFVYNTQQTIILGAYTHKNNSNLNLLPVQPIAGEEIIVEYQQPADTSFEGEIEIGEVNHDFRGLFRATEPRDPKQTCHPNVICYSEDAKPSSSVIGLIINGNTYCTGSLVNNTAKDGTPYILTATHCLNNDYNASFLRKRHYDVVAGTIVAFFNYQSPVCGINNTENIRGPVQLSMASMDSVYISEKHDISLLKLKEMPPREFQPFLSGWDATASPTPIFHGIHHPNGGIKKVAIDNDNLKMGSFGNDAQYGMTPNSHWFVMKWETGNTEQGSSGSPLYDFEKRVVGTLTAGESMCSSPRGKDIYAALYKAWETAPNIDNPHPLKFYLDPINSNSLQMGGLNPYEKKPMTKVINYSVNESVTVTQTTVNKVALFSTNNILGYTEFAEEFNFKENTRITGVFITSAAISNIADMHIKIRIYTGKENPENLVYETPLIYGFQYYQPTNNFASKHREMSHKLENYVHFDSPMTVSGKCFIGYAETNAVSPGFAALNTAPRTSGTEITSTAWMKDNTGWIASSKNINDPLNTSLLIAPYVIGDTSLVTAPPKEDFEIKVLYQKDIAQILITSNSDLLSWELFNTSGQKIAATTIDKSINRASYRTKKLSKGVYIVKVNTPHGNHARKILIY